MSKWVTYSRRENLREFMEYEDLVWGEGETT